MAADTISYEIIQYGKPVTKGRARMSRYGGVYTPTKTRIAENIFKQAVRDAYPNISPDKDGQYLLWARFYQKGFQRQDLDNMVKLISDACNNLVWADDVQVIAVDAQVERGVDNPRSHIVLARIADKDERPTGICPLCQTSFRRYPSWMTRDACSVTCAMKMRQERLGVDLSIHVACEECSKLFRRKTSAQHLCSEMCRVAWLTDRRKGSAKPNFCADCGIQTANRNAKRCRTCWQKSRKYPPKKKATA